MDIVIRTGFAAITHNIQFEVQKIVKGKALAEKNVRRVEELVELLRCSVINPTKF